MSLPSFGLVNFNTTQLVKILYFQLAVRDSRLEHIVEQKKLFLINFKFSLFIFNKK